MVPSAAPRPAWLRPERSLVLALVAMSAIVLMSRGSLLALPGPLEHVPKALELLALGALGYDVARARLVVAWPLPLTLGLLFVLHAVVSGLWSPYQDSFVVQIFKLLHAVLLAPILCLACRRVGDVTLLIVVFK